MPIHLNNRNRTHIYHREDRFSIFGSNNTMNYGYVSIEDTTRNNQGLYTKHAIEPEYFQKGITQLNSKAPAPVWTLAQFDDDDYSEVVSLSTTENEQQTNHPPVITTITTNEGCSSKKFVWLYGGKSVYLTGTFDDWKASIPMTPVNPTTDNTNENVFEVTVDNLDMSKDNTYKFVVDGEWCYDVEKDFIVDASGNVNNIIYATTN